MKILQQPPSSYHWLPVRIVIVTGLSNPTTCRLTEHQKSIVTEVEGASDFFVPWNFPFLPDSVLTGSVPRSEPTLLTAAIANGLQFLRSRTEGYRRAAEPHWNAVLNSSGRMILITGSCGIQLAAASGVLRSAAGRIKAIALGPTGGTDAVFPVTTVQGDRDWISRRWYRQVDHPVPEAGHMDYWEHPEVRERVQSWLRCRISE